MLYHAIMIFGLNEVGPTNPKQLLLVIFLMVVASILNAIIFGEIAVLVQQLDQKDIELQNTLDNANTAMRNLAIPDNIQENIREYLMSVNDNKTQQNEMIEFFNTLKPKLKEKVCLYIFFVAIA
jgi:hypothetical protein